MNLAFTSWSLVGFLVLMEAHGQAGQLDPSFDGDGVLTMDPGAWDKGYSVMGLPDGKMLVGGSIQTGDSTGIVCRLLPDGALDMDFGIGGRLLIAGVSVRAMELQTDGKIVVCGSGGTASDWDFGAARIMENGVLDPTFGQQGIVVTDMGYGHDQPADLMIQPDGKVVVAGTGKGGDGLDHVALVRYTQYGALDTGFGSGGKVIAGVGFGSSVVLMPGGELLVGGGIGTIQLTRFTSNGALATAFGNNGLVTTDLSPSLDACLDMVLQPDGKIVVGGVYNAAEMMVVRYDASGLLDDGFGQAGVVSVDMNNSTDFGIGLLPQPDGRIILVGRATWDGDDKFALLRLDPDGSLDGSFGVGGKTTTSIAPGNAQAYCASLDVQGRILVAGQVDGVSQTDIAVARYLSGLDVGVAQFGLDVLPLRVFPDPLADQATLEYELSSSKILTCELLDAHGRTARTLFVKVHRNAGRHRESIDLSGLAAGSYAIILSSGEERMSVGLVKQ